VTQAGAAPSPPPPGPTFQWPVIPENRLNTIKDYAQSQICTFGPCYHAGMDIWAEEGTTVVAAQSGSVRTLWMDPNNPDPRLRDNHCMGNVVIIDHGSNVYSLYAHLKTISVPDGATVTRGQKIGEVGSTGDEFRSECLPFGKQMVPHLHFELKSRGVLGSPDGSLYWGYTPSHPNQHGYFDPVLFLHTWRVLGAITVRIATDGVRVRMGPNSSPPGAYPILESLTANSQLTAVAIASATSGCVGGWYMVVRPGGGLFGGATGVPDGWICADFASVAMGTAIRPSETWWVRAIPFLVASLMVSNHVKNKLSEG
jgi:hypothetical protein